MRIANPFHSLHLGLDCGAHRLRLLELGNGIVVDEPTVLAVESRSNKVLAIGAAAEKMAGRVGNEVILHWPMMAGEIADEAVMRALLQAQFREAKIKWSLMSPTVMVTVPAAAESVAKESWSDVLYGLGAGSVYTIAEPLAASIGAGVPIADASGSFLVQMGYDRVEAVVVSLGSIVASASVPVAGRKLISWLQYELRESLELIVSPEQAAHLLHHLGSLYGDLDKRQLVSGKDASSNHPKELEVSSAHLARPILRFAERLQQSMTELLSDIRPELTTDVVDKGFLLSGGLAQLHGLDAWLIERLGVPVSVVDSPSTAAIRGVGTTLAHLDEFRNSLGYHMRD
ncbi:MAG: hypothetical protein COY80_01845 [Candidatus Pacebacteria bacterium CG_4_10_14_0_8_um_filter_42_14]|nr:MAG: hypothetical protein COY80_01845 [Candidatus Pacebacteria bacterium CG_4_10_14_0_8_um_filter_42_14]